MTRAPSFFRSDPYILRRVTAQDLSFITALMSALDMHAHKPDPTLPTKRDIACGVTADLTHWEVHGFGRYVAFYDMQPIGLCGLTRRDGMAGLNLSYHVLRTQWGHGHASALVSALMTIAHGHLTKDSPVYGLVRPVNPASARVLEKAGFAKSETLTLGGAPTIRYTHPLVP